jgi:hypothetical protein
MPYCFLSKDAAKSSKRKATRGMSIPEYTYCVARTTFRGKIFLQCHFSFCRCIIYCLTQLFYFLKTAHALGVAAAWVVQSIVQVYKCFVRRPDNDEELLDEMDKFRLFGRKIYSVTIKCGFSLVFASIGAGIGALLHPMHGQWIGELRLPFFCRSSMFFEEFEVHITLAIRRSFGSPKIILYYPTLVQTKFISSN